MKKALLMACLFAASLFVAGCNSTSCPPASFIPGAMKMEEATERPPTRGLVFKVPAGFSKTQVWQRAVRAYQPEFNSHTVDLEKGLIVTEWRYYTHVKSSGFDGGYRVRLSLKLTGPDWRTIRISAPATWREDMKDPKTEQTGDDGAAMEKYYNDLKAAFAKK